MNLDIDPMPDTAAVPVAEVSGLAEQLLRQARLLNENGDTIDALHFDLMRAKLAIAELLALMNERILVLSDAGRCGSEALRVVRCVTAAKDALEDSRR